MVVVPGDEARAKSRQAFHFGPDRVAAHIQVDAVETISRSLAMAPSFLSR